MSDDRIDLFEGFTLDLERGSVRRGDKLVHLRPQTYEVLMCLLNNRGHLISKDQLINEVWKGRAVTDGSLGKCIEELREALGPEAREHIRNVRGRGYIFEAGQQTPPKGETLATRSEQVEFVSVTIEEHQELPDATILHLPTTAPRTTHGLKTVAIAAGLSVLVLSGLLAYRALSNRAAPRASIKSIAVLPFRNDSGNPELEYLSDGMTETLIISLSRLPNVSVKSRSSVRRFKDQEIDPKQAGVQLSVQSVLTGRVVQHGDDLTLFLSLVDPQTGNQLWGERYARKLPDLATLQTEISRDVSQQLRPLTGTEAQALTKGSTANSQAYLAYLKGEYYWSKFPRPGYEKSREYFQQSIDIDPAYAMGYTGLAHYYGFAAAIGMKSPNENWPRSEDAINKALALDDTLAETHNARVGIQLYYHRDWRAAEQSFRRGVELNPNSAEVHHHYARCLLLFGRNDEALAEMKRTVELEPLSLRYNQNLATLYFFTRQYDQALDQLRKTLELEPNYGPAREWLGNTYQQKGMRQEALAEWIAALKLKGENNQAADLEHTYGAKGFDSAVRFLGQLQLKEGEERSQRGDYVSPAEYVLAYTRLGDKEKALEWLDKAVDVRDRQALEFKVNPLFDSLRGDQRFQAALERIVINQ